MQGASDELCDCLARRFHCSSSKAGRTDHACSNAKVLIAWSLQSDPILQHHLDFCADNTKAEFLPACIPGPHLPFHLMPDDDNKDHSSGS